jgi:uncharacterized membrane protein HdeD (DUF308 family)
MPTKVVSSLRRQGLYWGGSMRWGVALIVLGVLSVALVLTAVAVNLVTVWLIVLTGLAQLIIALHTNRVHGLIWRLIVGFAYVLVGAYPDRLSRAGLGFTHFGASSFMTSSSVIRFSFS